MSDTATTAAAPDDSSRLTSYFDPKVYGTPTQVMSAPPVPSADDIAAATQTVRMMAGVQDREAPINTRIAVGAESSDADRLAALQRLQTNAHIEPDAALLPGSSNMIYTEPSTGRRTLYRGGGVSGFIGDVASVAPVATGGLLGGTAAAIAAAPSVLSLGPAGPALGFGLGYTGGAEGTRDIIEALAGTSGVRNVPASLLNTATETGFNTVMPGLGEAVLSPLARAWSTVDPFNRVPSMLPGDLLGSPTLQAGTKAIYGTPGGAVPISATSHEAAAQTGAFRDQVAGDITNATRVAAGQPPTMPTAGPDALGRLVQNAATRAAANWQTQVGQLTQTAENAVGANTPTSVAPLVAARAKLQQELDQSGETGAIQPAIDRLDGIIATANKQGGALPWSVVRGIRTNVNQEMDNGQVGQIPITGSSEYEQVGDALSQSLGDAAQQAGPGAAEAWRRYNAVISNYRQAGGAGATISMFAKPETSADTIASRFLSGSKGDAQQLAYLRSQASAQDWDQIAGSMFSRLGIAKPGAQDATGQVFSPQTFLTNWNNMSQAGRNTLFGGTRYDAVRDDIDYLANLSQAQTAGEEFANRPGTGRQWASVAVLQALGTGLASLATGDFPGIRTAAGTATGLLAAPYAGAKLMTSKPFLGWLRTAATSPPGAWNANLARLGSVAATDPSVKDIVGQLQQILPSQLPQGQPAAAPQ
jgi:hypothetical protein